MIKLTTGKKTYKELAEWFGVKPNSFSKMKFDKLKELENFAEFEITDSGKVNIIKVLNPYYEKLSSEAYQKIRDKVDDIWDEAGLDSCSHVSDQIVEFYGEDLQIMPSTAYAYTIKSRDELYGKPFMNGGSLGSCTYLWCKKNEETGGYEYLTPEEKEVKQRLQTKYFGDASEKQILVKAMVEAGEIKREEAWDVLEEMTNMRTGNFLAFLKELQDAIGCKVVRGTLVERKFLSAF